MLFRSRDIHHFKSDRRKARGQQRVEHARHAEVRLGIAHRRGFAQYENAHDARLFVGIQDRGLRGACERARKKAPAEALVLDEDPFAVNFGLREEAGRITEAEDAKRDFKRREQQGGNDNQRGEPEKPQLPLRNVFWSDP